MRGLNGPFHFQKQKSGQGNDLNKMRGKPFMRLRAIVAGSVLALSITSSLNAQPLFNSGWWHSATTAASSASKLSVLAPQMPDLNPKVLQLALKAYQCAQNRDLTKKNIITIIDYSKPDTQKRLWVVDLNKDKVLFHTLVAHGQGSGGMVPNFFSDKPETHASSLGVFLTSNTYNGHDGYSLKLDGLEPGFNAHANERNVVMHGASYVSQQIVNQYGRLGRSWGCPAVPKTEVVPIVNTIKNGSLVFAYYPDRSWLSQSKFLNSIN